MRSTSPTRGLFWRCSRLVPAFMRSDVPIPRGSRAQRHTNGSVRYDKRRKTWNYLWYEGPVRRSRRIGTKQDFPTKAAAWKAVERLEVSSAKPQSGDTVRSVIALYETERMPSRHSTAR